MFESYHMDSRHGSTEIEHIFVPACAVWLNLAPEWRPLEPSAECKTGAEQLVPQELRGGAKENSRPRWNMTDRTSHSGASCVSRWSLTYTCRLKGIKFCMCTIYHVHTLIHRILGKSHSGGYIFLDRIPSISPFTKEKTNSLSFHSPCVFF